MGVGVVDKAPKVKPNQKSLAPSLRWADSPYIFLIHPRPWTLHHFAPPPPPPLFLETKNPQKVAHPKLASPSDDREHSSSDSDSDSDQITPEKPRRPATPAARALSLSGGLAVAQPRGEKNLVSDARLC